MFNFLTLSTKPQIDITTAEQTSTITNEKLPLPVVQDNDEHIINFDSGEVLPADMPFLLIEDKKEPAPCDAGESIEEATTKDEIPVASTIEKYLNTYGFKVDYGKSHEYDIVCEQVKSLAIYIAEHYEQLRDFLGYLRSRLAKDLFVSYSMERLNETEKAETIKFTKDMLASYGMLSNTYINFATGVITGQIPPAKRITAFLSGGWLELYVRTVVEDIVSKRAKELGVDYQVYSNLLVSKNNTLHELDVVFKLANGRMCWIECKSGKFTNFLDFYNLGVDLSTIPTCTLLFNANATSDDIAAIRYFYDIHCCNLNRTLFISQISEMLNKSISINN